MDAGSHGFRLHKHREDEELCHVCLPVAPSLTGLADIVYSRVLRYLVSTWFSSVVLRTDSKTLPPYIPISVVIGILLTICLDHIWHESRKAIRGVCVKFRDWNIDWIIRMLQPAPQHHEVQLLPLYKSTAATVGGVSEIDRSVY